MGSAAHEDEASAPRRHERCSERALPIVPCALHWPGLSVEDCRTESFRVGFTGQAEQGGGDDSREDDAARAREEGGVVADVEDG
jgi:hypothetical protein